VRRRVLSCITGVVLALGLAVSHGQGATESSTEHDVGRWPAPFELIVLDPGHGGDDHGASGRSGRREKDVVLRVAKRIGKALQAEGFRVLYTRQDDRFVSLPERTEMANRAHASLFVSIHANASEDSKARGAETYFLSLSASDEEARRVAMAENRVFDQPAAVADSADVVGSILGDLIRTSHLRESSEVATAIQHRLQALPGPSRGVKQAPFVVLMGVNMPAVLLEIGFLTHREEERKLGHADHQEAIARAVVDALVEVGARRHRAADGEAERDESEVEESEVEEPEQ